MKRIFFTVLMSLAVTISLSGQIHSSWFNASELAPGTWVIDDHGSDNMYLIEGADSAMLIDNGLGTADLRPVLKKLTSKPLIVVITHGHPDHAGSDYQFEKVYIHPADSSAAKQFNMPEARAASAKNMQQGTGPAESDLYKGKPFNTRMIPLKDGMIFDLGSRRIQVIEAPGHTPGEICLIDIGNKYLFTGDNNNVLVWLFLQNCRPLHEYLTTLEKLSARSSEFKTIFPGHGAPLPADFINDQIECVKGILNNTLERKPYKSFAGEAMVSVYGRASVTFNPDNL
jgi:glyoxylase-like metal-dependent hydrolase (beta-lactamase superfamily II)